MIGTTTLDDPFDDPAPQRPRWVMDEFGIWRDHLGRAGIMVGDKRVPYSRASGIGKAIDDQYGLAKWWQRGVMLGLLADHRLIDSVGEVIWSGDDVIPVDPFGEPTPEYLLWLTKEKRDRLDELCALARSRAGQDEARERGTLRHRLSEDFDNDQMTRDAFHDLMPSERDFLRTYWRLTREAGLRFTHREVFLVADSLKVAGTADGIAALLPRSPIRLLHDCNLPHVVDLKTGSAEYGSPGWNAQFAGYALGVPYDVETDRRDHTFAVPCQEFAFALSIPDGDPTGRVLMVNLAAGRWAIEVVNMVRELRNAGKRKCALPVAFEPEV